MDKVKFSTLTKQQQQKVKEYHRWLRANIMYLYGGCGNPCCTEKKPIAEAEQQEWFRQLEQLKVPKNLEVEKYDS